MKIEKIKEAFYKEAGDEYVILDDRNDISTHEKLKVLHTKCGNIIEISKNKFVDCHQRCVYCSGKKKYTVDEFKQKMINKFGDEYTIIGEYKNTETPILFHDNIKDEDFKISPRMLLEREAYYEKEKNKEEGFKKKVYSLVGDEYSVIGKYESTRRPIKMKHNTCGTEYFINPESFLNGSRCKKCYHLSKIKNDSTFKTEVQTLTQGEYTAIGSYEGNKKYIIFKHKDHFFKMKPNDFLQGHRCPICAKGNHRSNGEKEVLEYLHSINVSDEKTNILFERKYEIDIYFEERHLGIEYNGLYWHSANVRGKRYQLEKMKFFKDRGIHLIQIFEDEWVYHKDAVKTRLTQIFFPEIEPNNNCEVKYISKDIRDAFLENYSFNIVPDKSSINVGLYKNNNLESIMALSEQKKSKFLIINNFVRQHLVANDIEMIINYIKQLKTDYTIKMLLDLRWYNEIDNLLLDNNFKFKKYLRPKEWLAKDDKRFPIKKVATDKSWSIYDCGYAEYIKKI